MALEATKKTNTEEALRTADEPDMHRMEMRSLQIVGSGAAPTAAPRLAKRPARPLHHAETLRAIGTRALRGVRHLLNLITEDTLTRPYWPEAPRKSKARIAAELLWWLLRHGEINHFYYLYGLDRKDARPDELMAYRAFRRRRDRRNLRLGRLPYNYVCVLRDKFLFSQFLKGLGVPTPRSFALFDPTSVVWLERRWWKTSLARVADTGSSRYDGFCKRIDGTQGVGAFPLLIERGRLSSNGVELSSHEFCKLIDGRFLFQERIEQHPSMSSLHPASVNTLRLITYYQRGQVRLLCASARMGTGGRAVDNWSAGGLTVGVDVHMGELHREAFFKPGFGGRTTRHPDTGVTFAGFRIPHFHDAVDLVIELHGFLPQIHSIGWDIAISRDGPVLLEGNDDWHGIVPLLHERNARRRLEAMFESA